MARYPLSLPIRLKRAAEACASQQGVSLNQFILWAVAEKVGELRQFSEIRETRPDYSVQLPISLIHREKPAFRFPRRRLTEVCRKNGITWLAVFGSVARGEAAPESDLDLLVRFSDRKSLLSMVRLERELTGILGKKVDLQTEASLSPYIHENIQRDLKVIYEA